MILLVNPWIHDFSAYDLWIKPLGLLYIGGFLEQHGYEVRLIDCLNGARTAVKPYGCGEFYREEIAKPCHFSYIPRTYKRYGIPPSEFTNRLLSLDDEPDLICVTSVMTYWYQGASEAIHYLRKTFPAVPIALGGVYATLCPEHAHKKSGADYVIPGSGEKKILELAHTINPQSAIGNPQSSVYPAYHLYDKLTSVSMLTSRGCPFHCSYCASRSLNERFYQRNPDEVVGEIKHYIDRFAIKDIAFYDDALLFNREQYIDIILDRIIEDGINKQVRFHTPNGLHIRYIDQSLAAKLYQANFRTLRLGFEGVDDPTHKSSPADLPKVLGYLYQAGYHPEDIGVYVLMGLPGQPLAEVDKSIDFVHQSRGVVKIAQYSPVPGTPDYERAVKEHPEIATEPLLHNKSIYYARSTGTKFGDFEALKDKVKHLNAKLLTH